MTSIFGLRLMATIPMDAAASAMLRAFVAGYTLGASGADVDVSALIHKATEWVAENPPGIKAKGLLLGELDDMEESK